MISIREVNPEKTSDLLAELHNQTFQDSPMPGWYGHWWVAFVGKLPVAFIGLQHSTLYPGCGYFARVGVLEMFWGHGLQKRLMRTMERKARKLNMPFLVSDTNGENIPSDNNFITCGWRRFEPETRWAFARGLYWRKEL